VPQRDETEHREIVQAFIVAAHTTGEAINSLAADDYWREVMALARNEFETLVNVGLLCSNPSFHRRVREHESRVKARLKAKWGEAPDEDAKAPNHWLGGTLYGAVRELAKTDEGIGRFIDLVYPIACSFTHADLLSVRQMDAEIFAAFGCDVAASCLFRMAEYADELWHEGHLGAKQAVLGALESSESNSGEASE
jgi:hypothetical protein